MSGVPQFKPFSPTKATKNKNPISNFTISLFFLLIFAEKDFRFRYGDEVFVVGLYKWK